MTPYSRNSTTSGEIHFIHESSEPNLYDQLFSLWQCSKEVHVATAFLSVRMLNILIGHLRDVPSNISVRFLTGSMNYFNEPRVLKKLLEHFGPENVRLYQHEDSPEDNGFHVKAYMFHTSDAGWSIVLGSSNFTAAAMLGTLTDSGRNNAEWNLLVSAGNKTNDQAIAGILSRFNHYWTNTSVALSPDVLESYHERWKAHVQTLSPTITQAIRPSTSKRTRPREIQRKALQELAQFRQMAITRAAVIGATGIGKTMIAAFDIKAMGAKCVLFVAHREFILSQAHQNFRALFGARFDYHQLGGDEGMDCVHFISSTNHSQHRPYILFAMVQTLSNPQVYSQFDPSYFDYIVVDEFHHASAPSYNPIVYHFQPDFLLGLTATPERLDGRDVLEICDYNIALEVRLFDAIDEQCLAPFLYFAIYDETDYQQIRWTGIGYDEKELESALSNDTRAELIAQTLDDHLPAFGKVKGIAFCANVGHARYMTYMLKQFGYKASCIVGETSEAERTTLLKQLSLEEDPLNIICTVDVLSEGVDVPALTHILLLRPTQSFTVFLQQLGRGLRLHPQKDFLIVLDFVGNYRNNYVAPLVLTGHNPGDSIRVPRGGLQFKAPQGCYIHPDTKVHEIWLESTRAKFAQMNTKDRLKQLYIEIWQDLGYERSPRIMDFWGHPLCANPMKFIKNFKNWLRVKAYCGGLDAIEKSWLDEMPELFLQHIEQELKPNKSYKMVVLLILLEMGTTTTSWQVEDIAVHFRAYFAANPLRLQDYPAMAQATNPTLYPLNKVIQQLKSMPLKYLSDKPEKFFSLHEDTFSLKASLHPYWAQPEFRECIQDRVLFALKRYWDKKYADVDLDIIAPTTTRFVPASKTNEYVKSEPKQELLSYEEVQDKAFQTSLPFIADVAAGPFEDSLESGSLQYLEELEWIEVPENLARKNRFVIRIDGDSMQPEFELGDWVIFEYHRSPRQNNQIVLAADYSLGEMASSYAVKRLREDKNHWIFESTNPEYPPVTVSKEEVPYPIVGTFVSKL